MYSNIWGLVLLGTYLITKCDTIVFKTGSFSQTAKDPVDELYPYTAADKLKIIDKLEADAKPDSWTVGPACLGYLTIDVTGGDKAAIYVIKAFDYESAAVTNSVMLCEIIITRAADATAPTATSTLTIPIIDRKEFTPQLVAGTSTTCTIPEETAAGSVLTGCNLVYTDADVGDVITCAMSGIHAHYFTITTDHPNKKCVLSPVLQFDRDNYPISVPSETLAINIKLTDIDGLSSETPLNVVLTDINDNDPVCLPPERLYYVSELVTDPLIATILCTDKDKDANAKITYTIVSGAGTPAKFKIDPISGQFSGIGNLDYDGVISTFDLSIKAEDGGTVKRSSLISVKVIVIPQNEFPPVWGTWIPPLPAVLTDPYTSVNENSPDSTPIFTAKATDNDNANTPNGQIAYSLQSVKGIPTGGGAAIGLANEFMINTLDGQVFLKTSSVLDAEKFKEMEFVVVASDQKGVVSATAKSVLQTVRVLVTDVNEFPPKFLSIQTTVDIIERSNSQVVYTIPLTDEDATNPPHFVCEIVSGDGNPSKFEFVNSTLMTKAIGPDPDNGVDKTQYELVVNCKDNGGVSPTSKSARGTLIINIIQSNDHAPTITSTSSTVTLAENNGQGSLVMSFNVGDLDGGDFGKYECSIDPSSAPFTLTSDCTKMFQTGPLDYETLTSYSIKAVITDTGGKTSNFPVTITVTNVNDNLPSCSPAQQTVSITEHDTTTTPIASITCVDKDVTTSPAVTLSLENAGGVPFTLDPSNGQLTIKAGSVIDYDTGVAFYKLVVRAEDINDASVFTLNYITVVVNPKNDNDPTFTPTVNTITIFESAKGGDFVFKMVATDADKPPHGLKTFGIQSISNSGSGKFVIDNNGKIFVAPGVTLDYDTMSPKTYIITVTAEDGSTTATGTLTVTISDVNDHIPIFTSNMYLGEISEDGTTTRGTTTGVTVIANDGDSDAILYSKNSGDPSNFFSIASTTGVITRSVTGPALNYDSTKLVSFTVKAVDRPSGIAFTSTTNVIIKILDLNLAQPVCTPSTKTESENIALGTILFDLKTLCSDADTTQTLSYSLISPLNAHFSVNPINGEILLVKKLNFESTANYPVVVEVSDDHATDKKSSNVSLTVTATNYNEFRPVCTTVPSAISILESTPATTIIFKVDGCSDNDTDSVLTYKIAEANNIPATTGPFTIDSNGNVKVAGGLNYEDVTKNYLLEIEVKDNTMIPGLFTSTYTVDVQILPVNEFPPVVGSTATSGNVSESSPIGDEITLTTALTATDADTGSNHGTIYWRIVSGNDDGFFTLDAVTGKIYLDKNVDYEAATKTHTLTLEAYDGAGMVSTGKTSATITITDVNDNKPFFKTIHQTVNVMSGFAGQNTLIDFNGQILDYDTTPFDASNISLLNSTSPGDFIVIGGILKTAHALPVTPIQAIIKVKVKNTASPYGEGTATVTVNILQNNSFVPNVGPTPGVSVPENTAIGAQLTHINGSDLDPGYSGTLKFSITNGNTADNFLIDENTGWVYLKNALDFESTKNYVLTVRATDQGTPVKTGSTIVSIFVTDVNDNDPLFKPPPDNSFSLNVLENKKAGYVVTTIKTSDADESGAQPVTCSIVTSGTPDPARLFDIPVGSCELKVFNSLNRETKSYESVLVEIKDKNMTPVRSSRTFFHITIDDINDEDPSFAPLTAITVAINETVIPGTFVTQVIAKDQDAGLNGVVTYSLSGVFFTHFEINPNTGIVTTKNVPDRENIDTYYLKVTATDGGAVPRSSELNLTIEISDLNDNIPIITNMPYTKSIPEDAPASTKIVQIVASDLDSQWGVLSYSILSGDVKNLFRISSKGLIETTKPDFDRETVDNYTLLVQVSDNGLPPNAVTVNVSVTITDVNDVAPIVPYDDVQLTISENSEFGSVIYASLNVTDPDLPPDNNRLSYYIDANIQAHDDFQLDPVTGQFSVKNANLDRENSPLYIYRIGVKDNGNPQKSSTLTLTISLIDQNDNTPIFTAAYFNSTIPENLGVTGFVLQLTATDIDLGINAEIDYSMNITESSSANAIQDFKINRSTGIISVNASLDRETKPYYLFQVLAVDKGSPKRTGTASVFITVTDVNDVAPTVVPSFYDTEVPTIDNGTMVLATVGYTDPDTGLGGQVYYKWTTSVIYFLITASDGTIRRNPEYSLTAGQIYIQYASAVDKGTPSLTSASPGTIRIDSFKAEDYVVLITMSTSMGDFLLYKNSVLRGLSKVMANRYPDNRIGLWKVVHSGSNIIGYFYGVKFNTTNNIANIDKGKQFIPVSELLDIWREDAAGRPTAGLTGSDFRNVTITHVEPYPVPVEVPWYQTPGGIAGLFFAVVGGLALLIGGIVGGVMGCRGSSGSYTVNPTSKLATRAPANPTSVPKERKLLELNKDKHPNKVDPKEKFDDNPRPTSSSKTRVVNQDIADKVYEPSSGLIHSYDVPANVYQPMPDF